MAKKRKERFKVGQRVMITHCKGTIVEIRPFARGRGYMLAIQVAGGTIPCYREEVRPFTARARGDRGE